MRRLTFVIASLVLVGLTSCGTKPQASFKMDSTTIAVNDPITVTSTSTDAKTYYWVAKDMNQSELDESVLTMSGDGYSYQETFTFTIPGTYTLHLCVGHGIYSDEVDRTVTVTEAPADNDSGNDDGGGDDNEIPTR